MEFDFRVQGKNYKVGLEKEGDGFTAEIDGAKEKVDASFADANTITLILGGKTVTVYVAFDGDRIEASVRGEKFEIEKSEDFVLQESIKARAGILDAERTISTPMPGQIVKIQVKEGEVVEADQNLFIVESMKMENQIKAPMRARVDKIYFKDGDAVLANSAIMELTLVPQSD
jgi:biotin carboxyl carrier protein